MSATLHGADQFSARESLTGAVFSATGSTSAATAEAGEPGHAGTGAAMRSLWWQWTAPATGVVRIDSNGNDLDTALAVYRGSSLAGLTRVVKNDDAGLASGSSVTFKAVAGEKYQIAIDELSGNGGSVTLAGAQRSDGLIYASDFSALEIGTGTLGGHQSWQSLFADSASGITDTGGLRRGFLSADGIVGNVGGLWLPVNYAGTGNASDRILISSNLTLSKSSTPQSESFMFLVYNEGGAFIAGLELDLASGAVLRLDGVASQSTGKTFQKGIDQWLDVLVDPAGNKWTARFGDTVLFENAPFTATGDAVLPFGAIALAWTTTGTNANADAEMLFTDVEISDAVTLPEAGWSRSRSPYGGVRASIPGRVEMEAYDEGGAGVAYYDTTLENQSHAFRTEGVDIEFANGGHHISWFRAGEWLMHSVEVPGGGRFRIDVRVASRFQGGIFHLELDGKDISGELTVPDTTGWVTFTTLSFETAISTGLHDLKLVGVQNSSANGGNIGNIDWVEFTQLAIAPPEPDPEPPVEENPGSEDPSGETPGGEEPGGETPAEPAPAVRAPFLGGSIAIPGQIEMEWFDLGGEGLAYSDTSAANEGGAYRTEGVDIETNEDGYDVGWFRASEWMLYSVEVEESANYRMDVRLASEGEGGVFRVDLDDAPLSGDLTVPDTDGWQAWQILSVDMALAKGAHSLKVLGVSNSSQNVGNIANVDWIRFTKIEEAEEPGPEVPPEETPASEDIAISDPIASAAGIDLSWNPTAGADRYEVWRGTDSFASAQRIATTTSTAWADHALEASGSYTYWIRALSSDGSVVSSGTVGAVWTAPLARLVNISTRGRVAAGEPMIAGFVVDGDASRRVLLRAIGPSLAPLGVSDVAREPAIRLMDRQVELKDMREGWGSSGDASQIQSAMTEAGAFALDVQSRDAAFVMDLEPGHYTAVVDTADGVAGNALVEVYALDPRSDMEGGRLINISTRGHASVGADALIAGFVIEGDESRQVLIRGAGPSLAGLDVSGWMQDPEIRIYTKDGDTPLETSDNWVKSPEIDEAVAATGAFAFEEGSRDAALLVELPPGPYTVVLTPASGDPGTALVEAYEVPSSR
ncbi:MAG: carbohydrate-binding protein [Opitutaceae bacterium]